MRIWNITAGLAVAVLLLSPQVNADEVGSLRTRVEMLERQVLELQKRLDSSPAQPAVSSAVPAGKQAWRKLKNGMGENEVRGLLGEPVRVENMGTLVFWRYGDYSDGSVSFKSNMRVHGWTEPD